MTVAKKALICGISGQDGAYLARFLLNKGYAVYGTSRDVENNSFVNLSRLAIRDQVNLLSADLTDPGDVQRVIAKAGADEIYNLAGQSSVGLSFEKPLETLISITTVTMNLLEVLRKSTDRVRFFTAGSGECFGETNGTPADEKTPFKPKSPYALAKAAAFWEVSVYRQAYSVFACSGILFNHESPLRPERFVTRKITSAVKRLKKGDCEKLRLGDISIRRDWGWAPEYIEAMWLTLQQDSPQDFIIATGEQHSLEDFVAEAFALTGRDWRDHVVVDEAFFRPTDLSENFGNPEKARLKLGWQATAKMSDVVKMMLDAEER